MNSCFNRIICVFLACIAVEAQAMWKLSQKIIESNEQELITGGFIEELISRCQKNGVNPNILITQSEQTALSVACSRDKSGELIKRLLEFGEVNMNTRTPISKVWTPLYNAILVQSWVVVDLLLAEGLALTAEDYNFIRSNRFIDMEQSVLGPNV